MNTDRRTCWGQNRLSQTRSTSNDVAARGAHHPLQDSTKVRGHGRRGHAASTLSGRVGGLENTKKTLHEENNNKKKI